MFTGTPPVAGITYTSWFPSKSLSKAMKLLSGDQVGNSSYPGSLVTGVAPVPSALATQISVENPQSLLHAILVPSGEYAGSKSLHSVVMSGCWFEPSGFIV